MLCSLARWQLSGALDRRGERPRRCAAHLARCASCQQYARRLEALHGRLAAGAKSAPRPPLVPSRRWLRPALASGALAVAIGAALYVLVPRGQPAGEPESPVAVAPEASGASPAPEPRAESAEMAVPGSLHPREPASPGRDALERLSVLFTAPPLQAELDALASDGRRGALAILGLGGVGPGQRIR